MYKVWSTTYNREKQVLLKDLEYPAGQRVISKHTDPDIKINSKYIYKALEDELKMNESCHYTF